MYFLILMVCQGLQCERLDTVGAYNTMEACEAAMDAQWDNLDDGYAVMCIESPQTRL